MLLLLSFVFINFQWRNTSTKSLD